MTQRAGRWSWTIGKAEAAVKPRQALEVLPIMAFFSHCWKG
ncbi:hypothetical protein [Planococcus sp. CPCC 101016]|nr:hypothetical protein [Planococcus sp. CPCC 101016]